MSTQIIRMLLNFGEKEMISFLKKIGEESAELIIASKNKNENEILNELADVLFHAIVLLKYNNLSIFDVAEVLKKRLGKSGVEEKNKVKIDADKKNAWNI